MISRIGGAAFAGSFLAAVGLTIAPCRAANLVDVNFQGDGDPAATGAAVLGNAGDVWTADTDPSSTPLVDVTGGSTPLSVAWQADGIVLAINVNIQPEPELMNAYMFNNTNGGMTCTVAGADPGAAYEMVLYTASGDAMDSNRSMVGNVNGVPFAAFGNPEPSFVAGQNYVELVTTADINGNLVVTIADDPANNFSGEIDLNGLQIQELPEPASAMALSLLAIAALRRPR